MGTRLPVAVVELMVKTLEADRAKELGKTESRRAEISEQTKAKMAKLDSEYATRKAEIKAAAKEKTDKLDAQDAENEQSIVNKRVTIEWAQKCFVEATTPKPPHGTPVVPEAIAKTSNKKAS